jgi:hypothetical protein
VSLQRITVTGMALAPPARIPREPRNYHVVGGQARRRTLAVQRATTPGPVRGLGLVSAVRPPVAIVGAVSIPAGSALEVWLSRTSVLSSHCGLVG